MVAAQLAADAVAEEEAAADEETKDTKDAEERARLDAVAERVGVAFGDVRCGCDDVLFADVVVRVAGRERIALGRR